ncbi:hypothetical protein GCM10010967_57060 [Dyadobacter beijingensis]|uniref:HTH hxlR-type domain-containing protein n=1 Tax=Dyadobacter beijingensis TaxID=365489 RepID=A0ABQ2IJ28_9BACT|nr:helix-turn-helix domain-containing protein [Dyadobacter beijingensis]GGN13478.1 hypothetical protein GCM10010967_57060 [Dyadobacter beijingensis]
MKENNRRSGCPVSSSLDIWGDKWSLLIVRDLMYSKERTYGELLRSEEKIATNILASRLSTLEAAGIISKLEHPESKAKVLYRLTDKGIDLLPVMIEIYLWGDKYFELSETHKAFLAEVKKDKAAFLERVVAKLRQP